MVAPGVGGLVKAPRSLWVYLLPLLVAVSAAAVCLIAGDCSLLTPDQKAHRLFGVGEFASAAETFRDPMGRGAALYRQGEFEEAAGVFAGYDTSEAAFNQGNSLVFLGRYDEAVARYERALELRLGWEDAVVNRDIAAARAAMLKREGGNSTGGMLGADDIVFSDTGSDAGEQVETEGGKPLSDEELRAIWLRQVQTRPADFLRAKFAYQAATRSDDGDGAP